MTKMPRIISESKIYHITLLSNNHQIIFEEPEDYDKFWWILNDYKKKCGFFLYAYCLMPNHIHLLIKEGQIPISQVIQRIEVRFVLWYNNKYDRDGHLFHNRFGSEPVEDETYFLKAVRYIHLNPVRAGICQFPGEYPYSSYRYYFEKGNFADQDMIFNLVRKDEFEQYHREKCDDIFLDIQEKPVHKLTDEEAAKKSKRKIKNQLALFSPNLCKTTKK